MAIKKITVENFTVFKKIEINFCDGINILIGENGTGKTHLLKAIYGFCSGISMCADNVQEQINDLTLGLSGNVAFLNPVPVTDFASLCSQDIVVEFKKLFHQPVVSKNGIVVNVEDDVASSLYVLSIRSLFRSNGVQDTIKLYTDKLISLLPNPTFIPAKDVLSMSKITRVDDRYSKSLDLDPTIPKIIKQALWLSPDEISVKAKFALDKISGVIDGEVFVKDDDTFWVRKNDGSEVPFTLEAEGFRKLGLLWQLLRNDSIQSVLLWDEPEANLNPQHIPLLVDILLELTRNGVQIFLATHDYNLMKYFSMMKKEYDKVSFISLRKTDDGVECEAEDDYTLLEHNAIIKANTQLVRDNLKGVF